MRNLRAGGLLLIDPRQRVLEGKPFGEKGAVRFFDRRQPGGLQPPTFEADQVEPVETSAVAAGEAVGRDVERDYRPGPDVRRLADAGELVYRGQRGDRRVVFQGDVPA